MESNKEAPNDSHDSLLAARVCTAMMRLGTRMAVLFDQEFRAHHLTQAQFRLLLAVWESPEESTTPSVLAEKLLIERATVTSLVTRLVDEGLLERLPGENRRTHQLVLTEAGRQKLQTVAPIATQFANTTLTSFLESEVTHWEGLLERLEVRLRENKGQ
jgi:DNA-binding MarR family transcriptional regulator